MRIQTIVLAASAALLAATFAAHAAHAAPPRLSLHPGLTVDFSVYGGVSSTGGQLGDYEFVNRVTRVSEGSYTYDFWFTGKAATSGSMTVSAADKRSAPGMRAFYGSGDMTMAGYTGFLALSDAVYAGVKAGRQTRLEFESAESPKTVQKIGEEDIAVLVNEHSVKLHTIKVRGSAGGTYWILDNPSLPVMLKGDTKWRWVVTSISDTGSAGAELVGALKSTGHATSHDILFASDSATVAPQDGPVLSQLASYLKANPKLKLKVEGHTDNIGGAAFNLALSQKRAEAVRDYLVSQGVDAGRLIAKGFGLTVPVADNATPEGRARNRRVVFETI